MENIMSQVKEVKKFSKKFNIPLTYIVFLCSIFLSWKPKYITLIGASNWVPENVKEISLGIFDLIFSNFFKILGILSILLVIILILDKNNLFNNIFPAPIRKVNDTETSWNQYSAIKRLFSLLINLNTRFYVFYFFLNILFGRDEKVLPENFLVVQQPLFYLNLLLVLFYLLQALFKIRTPIEDNVLPAEELILYIEINTFKYSSKKRILILKKKSGKKEAFRLVKEDAKEESLGKVYVILDKSDSLSDIVYHFNALKEECTDES